MLAATPAGEGDYIVQIALMGNPPEGPAVIRMIFRMRAVRSGAHFQFRCLMEQNEREWTHESIGNIDYTFEGSLDRARALRFDAFNTRIAEQLDMEPQRVSYIRCRTSNEALGFLGIDYHIATNGSPRVGFNDGFRFVTGFDEEGYEHDLLHIYFSQKFDGKETYRAFEEGIAAFYAGSWGEPYLEIQRQLGEFVDSHANVDLGVAYKDRVKIGLHDIRYAINALLVEEIEREHGFDAIVDVLHCGSEGERYFEMLDKYLEIDEQSFGESILQRLKGRG